MAPRRFGRGIHPEEPLSTTGTSSVRTSAGAARTRSGQDGLVSGEEWAFDASVVPRSASGIVLCGEPCGLQGCCRLGILVERLDGEDSAYFEIECPADHRESPDLAHGAWTAAVLSEMCGVLPVLLGTIAYMGTLTVRFQAPVPIGARLIGRATLEGRERRKLIGSCNAFSVVDRRWFAASMIMIAAQER